MSDKLIYSCDWCEEERSYEGENILDRVAEDGWIVMIREGEDDELCFCSTGCLVSFL